MKRQFDFIDEEEDVDIAGNIVVDPESDSSSSESETSDQELQDEIVSSDDETTKEDTNKKNKTQKQARKRPNIADFPTLEQSDDEDGNQKDNINDVSEYFLQTNPTDLKGKKAKAGSFASFGLSKFLLGNIAKKGYRQPTPIQRKTMPLIMANRDVVGMARTGSGKTAAFLLPLVEKLKAHSAKVGIRAIILSPSRELAVQTFRQFKEFSRGTNLRAMLLIGGDSMEDQFGAMMSNPDVVIATPGRFLHLKVEMSLELKSIEYVVYDEADRLFEMGFAEQLNELLAALPHRRQSLLFSATLPSSLINFAKAGLINPVLVRLDAESTISDQLEMAFIASKDNEREGNLLYLLQEVIKMPLASSDQLKQIAEGDEDDEDDETQENDYNNRGRSGNGGHRAPRFNRSLRLPRATDLPTPHSTIVFVPTKHHVEFITTLLKKVGYAVAYTYGSLDQHARRQQLLNFRAGIATVLVVTDVAARGIDIPVLANVINFSLPASSKIFVHRVGRTARAGHRGWAYSIVQDRELPYLLDLELFLGRKVLLTEMQNGKIHLLKEKYKKEHSGSLEGFEPPVVSYTQRLVLGSCPRNTLEEYLEMFSTMMKDSYDLQLQSGVATKAEKLYFRTRGAASSDSVRRTKELKASGKWDEQNLLFGANEEYEKDLFLAKLRDRKDRETVFEFGHNDDHLALMMAKRRKQVAPVQRRAAERRALLQQEREAGLASSLHDELVKGDANEIGYSTVNEQELSSAFEDGDRLLGKKSFRDESVFMSHYAPMSSLQDKQMEEDGEANNGSYFAQEAQRAAFDLADDDGVQVHRQTMQWDKKKGKYVNAKSTDKKFIVGESGARIPASYKAGKFEAWSQANGGSKHRVGAKEDPSANSSSFAGNASSRMANGKIRHKQTKAPQIPLKGRDDYYKQKKKVEGALGAGRRIKGFKPVGSGSGVNELRNTEQIRHKRVIDEKNEARYGNFARRGRGGGRGGSRGGRGGGRGGRR